MEFEVNPQIYYFCQLLQDPDPGMRYYGINWIYDFVTPYPHYGRGEDHDFVIKRLDTWAQIVVPAILEAGSLYDANPDVRIEAAHVLALLGTFARSALHDLITSLKDQDERVRAAAAGAIASMGKTAGSAASELTILIDDSKDVRSAAIGALMNICHRPTFLIPHLLEDLESTDHRCRMVAIKFLGRIGPPARVAIPTLLKIMKEGNWELSSEAHKAIMSIGITKLSDVPTLIEMLANTHPDIRQASVKALGNMGRKAIDAVPALIGFLKYKRGGALELEARKALISIGPSAMTYLLDALRKAKSNRPLLINLCRVLRHFGPKSRDAIPLLGEAAGAYKERFVKEVVSNAIEDIDSSWLAHKQRSVRRVIAAVIRESLTKLSKHQ